MNLNRPDMTEDVKPENYTNNFLQMDSTPTTKDSFDAWLNRAA